jgi:hypothetical protein
VFIGKDDHLTAHSRGGLVTFVATKVTKKVVSKKASLPHGAFALQIRHPDSYRDHGLQSFAPFLFARASQTLLCPSYAQPIIVLPDSPEADLLT